MRSSAAGPRARTIRSREHHIRVPRTARYRVLGDPASATEHWFVLHGYRQLAERFIRRFQALPGVGAWRAVVAPEALSRFYVEDEVGPHDAGSRVGATWMTRADREHEIVDYVEYLDRVADEVLGAGARPRVVVLGFSQGAETASRWVGYGRTGADELILWGGGLAEDLDLDRAGGALRSARVRLVVGSEDRWAGEKAVESERRLRELGVEAERIAFPGGHVVNEEVLVGAWPE